MPQRPGRVGQYEEQTGGELVNWGAGLVDR